MDTNEPSIAKRYFFHQQTLVWLRQLIEMHETEMAKIQEECPHVWVFQNQVNAHSQTLWNVYWRCSQCTSAKVDEKIPPICPQCEWPLTPAEATDTEAHKLRVHAAADSPFDANAYRCLTCNTPHALLLKGD